MAITGAETDGDTISILEPRAASHLRLDPIHPVEPAWGARERLCSIVDQHIDPIEPLG